MTPTTLQRHLLFVALATAVLLLIPAAAMQFTAEVSWGPADFILAGLLLFGAGTVAVLGFKHVRGRVGRVALVGVISFSLALVWAELAVGIFN